MLDTNICIYILNKQPEVYLQKLEKIQNTKQHRITISSIVLAELQYGIANSKHKQQNQIKVNKLLTMLDVLEFSEKCALYYGEIRVNLKIQGTMIGYHDILIASHAICEEAILVTNNISEFKRIKGLIIEDWQ